MEPTARLRSHLQVQLGAWPPEGPLTVATCEARSAPGWDGTVREVAGLRTAAGTVLSVPADSVASIRELARAFGGRAAGRDGQRSDGGDRDGVLARLRPAVEERLGGRLVEAVFRWSAAPAPLDPLGEWVPAADPRVPEWLRPFGGDVLIAWDEHGSYLAGVGIKRHDNFGREISVGTEPAAQGRGLARRLVATAARRILDDGFVPTYLHALDNVASAKVADASGFPDEGWRWLFLARR